MCEILIFGGTTEGRLLAEYCHENQIEAIVSVASGYGAQILSESSWLHIHAGPLDERAMEELMEHEGIKLVLDATHPYAVAVTANIKTACDRLGIFYARVVRKQEECGNLDTVWVSCAKDGADYLEDRTGNILVTTGSKELSAFTGISHYKERIFVRVLPSFEALEACERLGIKGKHIIGMQGPFSVEMNRAMMDQYSIRYLVTKEAGAAGGFLEKLQAASACGVTSVIIGRPVKEEGITVEQAEKKLADHLPKTGRSMALLGIGMGGENQMTIQAAKALGRCDMVFGAQRMLESVGSLIEGIHREAFYLASDILPWLEQNRQYRRIGILYSGDTGFYSGAGKMAKKLEELPFCDEYNVTMYPGISSPAYLCALLHTSWEDVRLISLHGREWDILDEIRTHERIFVLLGGDNTVNSLCSLLLENKLDKVMLSVGEKLSYTDETVTKGLPGELKEKKFDKLCVVLLEKEKGSEHHEG